MGGTGYIYTYIVRSTNNKVSDESKVNGLSTPALAVGEFIPGKTEMSELEKPAKLSVLDIVTNIEAKMKALLQRIETDDKEIEEKLAQLSKKVEELRKS